MLEIIHGDNGEIKAVCEWYLVNALGEYDPSGDMIWVNECNIAPQYRGNGILKTFAKTIMEKCPQAKFGYFHRQIKYPDRGIRIYHKARWLKLLNGGK
jgi:hypothetical protein